MEAAMVSFALMWLHKRDYILGNGFCEKMNALLIARR